MSVQVQDEEEDQMKNEFDLKERWANLRIQEALLGNPLDVCSDYATCGIHWRKDCIKTAADKRRQRQLSVSKID